MKAHEGSYIWIDKEVIHTQTDTQTKYKLTIDKNPAGRFADGGLGLIEMAIVFKLIYFIINSIKHIKETR